MTLTQILAEMYRRTSYKPSPAPEIATRFTAFVNQAHRQILVQPWASRLRDDTIAFTTVANTPVYALPPSVAKIQHIQDRTSNRALAERSLGWLRTVDAGLTSLGGPSDVYVPRGTQQVAVQPADASELFIKSTSASDTINAYLEGIRTGGYRVALGPVTMTGVTAKSLSTTFTDLIEVTKVYLSAAAAGTVTLHEDSGAGTELARIPIGQTYARYQAIQIWPTPGSVISYHVDYTRTIPDMSHGNDEPLVPEDFSFLLVEGALMKEWTKKDDTRRMAAKVDYEEGLRALRSWTVTNPDTVASLRPIYRGFSQLGPSYPAGS